MLAHLFCKADSENFLRLSLAFPIEAEGMRAYLQDAGWWEHVERVGWDGQRSEEQLLEIRKQHISEKPPEWVLEYAKSFALQSFGLFYTQPDREKQVLPNEDIKQAVDRIAENSPTLQEWSN